MKIKVDINDPEVIAVLSSIEPNDYYIMGSFTKGPEEITLVSIHNKEWAQWIDLHKPEWILK